MFKWVMMLLGLAAGIGCLSATGVETSALAKLLLALVIMTAVSLLIARPFLRKKSPP